jgi:phospholipase/carboxylesterase
VQQTQRGAPDLTETLAARVFAVPEVEERPGAVAHPDERGIWLRDDLRQGPADAFVGQREIGHFHPWDHSLHIALPPELVEPAVQAGWAEVHPVARAGMAPKNMVMLYGPRDESEVDVLLQLIKAAIRRAHAGMPLRMAAPVHRLLAAA